MHLIRVDFFICFIFLLILVCLFYKLFFSLLNFGVFIFHVYGLGPISGIFLSKHNLTQTQSKFMGLDKSQPI